MVAVKGDNLSILEAENIGRGDIDCLARGSDSLGTNGQLTVMRSPNSMLDDHDVTRDVNVSISHGGHLEKHLQGRQ